MADIKSILKMIAEAEKAVDWKLVDDSKRYFGLTDDPMEAGYILPDGKFLDFTGRHLDDDYAMHGNKFISKGEDLLAGQRNTEHREVGEIYGMPGVKVKTPNPWSNGDKPGGWPEDHSRWHPMSDFMQRTRALRFVPEMASYSAMNLPNAAQMDRIRSITRDHRHKDRLYDHLYELFDPRLELLGTVRHPTRIRLEQLHPLVEKYGRYARGGYV